MSGDCSDGSCSIAHGHGALASKASNGEVSMNSLPQWMREFNVQRLVDSTGKPLEVLPSTPLIGLYFSAAWCPPCQAYSPFLSDFASKHSADLSVVFVSQDNSEAEMLRFIAGKSFSAIPFNHPARSLLGKKFNIMAIPSLIIVDAAGNLVTSWGRSATTKNPENCVAEWKTGSHGVSWLQLLKFW